MSLNTKVAGIWKDVSSVHVRVAGVWKPVANGWTKVGGVWKLVYSSLSAVLSSPAYAGFSYVATPGGSNTTVSVVCTLTVTGEGPFTYQWYNTGAPSATSGGTTDTYTLSLIDNNAVIASGTVWCDVTDSYGNTITTAVSTWYLELAEL